MNFYFRKEPWEQVPIEIIRNEVSKYSLGSDHRSTKERRDVDGNVVLVDGSLYLTLNLLEVTSHISLGVEPTPEQLEPLRILCC